MFSRLYERLMSDDYGKVLAVLLLIAFVIIFAGIGLRSPWPADEPRFAQVAREMVTSGNWFFPIRGGELYPDKPPVFMWAIALFYWFTGNMKVAFLLPNALASLLTLVCVYDIAAKLWNVRTARVAGLLLLLVPQFMLQAKTAQIDAMVACWITLAMYGLIRHFYVKPDLRWLCVSGFFMGVGIITKGVGFLPILFFIPVYIQQAWQHRRGAWRMLGEPLLTLGFMLLAVLCWLIPMLYLADSSGNPDFIAYRDNIMFKQTGERYANAWHHILPWWYYLVEAIPSLWFPLSFMLLSRSFWRFLVRHRIAIVLFAWVALVVFFFSWSPGKRGVYILPAVPMLALLMSPWLAQQSPERWLQRVIKALLWLVPVLLFVAAGMLLAGKKSLVEHLDGVVSPLTVALFFAGSGVAWLVILLWQRRAPALQVFGAVMAATWLLYSTWGYVVMEPVRAGAQKIMADTAERIGPDAELGLVKFKEQFLLFSPIPLTHFSYLAPKDEQYRNAWLWMQEQPNRYLLVPKEEPTPCFDMSGGELMGIGHGGEWLLLDRDDMLAECAAPKALKRYQMPFSEDRVL